MKTTHQLMISCLSFHSFCLFLALSSSSSDLHWFSALENEDEENETRRKICYNLKQNLNELKLNRKVPYFFKDRTTAYFG